MPDDLDKLVAEALCSCPPGFPERTGQHISRCDYHDYGPAVREALKKAERKGAREMREHNARIVINFSITGFASEMLKQVPLPHPEQESEHRRCCHEHR